VGDVTVEEGRVVKDAVAIMGSVTVLSGGRVTGNAVAIGGDVHLKANARVERDTVSIGGEILKEEGASVGGNDVAIGSVARHLVQAFGKWSLLDILLGSYPASLMLHILMVLPIAVLGIFLLLFLPGPRQIISSTIRQSTLKSGGWGWAALSRRRCWTRRLRLLCQGNDLLAAPGGGVVTWRPQDQQRGRDAARVSMMSVATQSMASGIKVRNIRSPITAGV
jgi:hypothetical protein